MRKENVRYFGKGRLAKKHKKQSARKTRIAHKKQNKKLISIYLTKTD